MNVSDLEAIAEASLQLYQDSSHKDQSESSQALRYEDAWQDALDLALQEI